MATLISNGPDETFRLGETWGLAAQSGLVIALSGDLGAGKTQLTKGIAHGLGVTDRVHSPTFAILNMYQGGRLPLFHLDLYRLETPDQIIAAGLEEYFHPQGVSVIEWAEHWFNHAGDFDAQTVKGTHVRKVQMASVTESQRRITYEDFGH